MAGPIAENRAPEGQGAAKLETHARREETEVPPPSPKTGPAGTGRSEARMKPAAAHARREENEVPPPIAENRAPWGQRAAAKLEPAAGAARAAGARKG